MKFPLVKGSKILFACTSIAFLSATSVQAVDYTLKWTDDFTVTGLANNHSDDVFDCWAFEIHPNGDITEKLTDASDWYEFEFDSGKLIVTWVESSGMFLSDAEVFIKQATPHYMGSSGWDGKMTLIVDFQGNDWSHLDITGKKSNVPDDGGRVPDGGTSALLLGLSLLGVGGARRLLGRSNS